MQHEGKEQPHGHRCENLENSLSPRQFSIADGRGLFPIREKLRNHNITNDHLYDVLEGTREHASD